MKRKPSMLAEVFVKLLISKIPGTHKMHNSKLFCIIFSVNVVTKIDYKILYSSYY